MRTVKLTASKLRKIIKEEISKVNEGMYSDKLPEPIGTTGSMQIDDEFVNFFDDYMFRLMHNTGDKIKRDDVTEIRLTTNNFDDPMAIVTLRNESKIRFVYDESSGYWEEDF